MKESFNKMKLWIKKLCNTKFIKNYYMIILFVLIAIISELTGVCVTTYKFYIRKPWIFLTFLGICVFVQLLIKKPKARFIFASIMLGIFGALNIGFIVVYEMTGQIFDYTMLELRKDAMGILESVPINIIYFFVFGIMFSAFILFIGRHVGTEVAFKRSKRTIYSFVLGLFIVIGLNVFSLYKSISHPDYYYDMLYADEDNSYCDYGITGNTVSQLLSGATKKKISLGDSDELNDFILNEDNLYNSHFKTNKENNYNVITILCESFEWFSMLQDLENYPNGLNLIGGEDTCKLLFPNLYRFYDESVVMDNYYSKEKTDISENYSYLGNYPTQSITNYDFLDNTFSSSMANSLKVLDPSIKANIFHNGNKAFYNRGEYEKTVGFDDYISGEDMVSMGMNDWMNNGERNLDADMVETCADLMFPTDNRFYTYIITITQHGQYSYRKSFKERGYYSILKKYGLEYTDETGKDAEAHNAYVNYVAGGLELDRMFGVIYKELEERGLLNNTIITMFGDHNCYYQGVSNYVKNIYSYNQAEKENLNFTELYRVPLMIRIPNKEHEVIHKFTTVSDLVPTMFDILGYNLFGNIYYGHSVFSEEESVMYSRAYDFYCTDKVLFTSLNRFKFINNDCDFSKYKSSLTDRTIALVNKIKYQDRIFNNDFYAKKVDNESKYYKLCSDNNLSTYGDIYSYMLKQINM